MIVVSKLLTGFDAPRNTVLYLCKQFREHNLLQALARVNRLFEENGQPRQFGYVIDYEGLLGELDAALTTYSSLEGCDAEDLHGVVHDIRAELRRLPQLHQHMWDLFQQVPNKLDHEQMEQHLADLTVEVIAPDDVPLEQVYATVRERARWIMGQIRYSRSSCPGHRSGSTCRARRTATGAGSTGSRWRPVSRKGSS